MSSVAVAVFRWIHHQLSRWIAPDPARQQVGPRRRAIRRWTPIVLVCLSLVVQAVLVYITAELVDLCISLMELWAELARKHLEITL